MEEKIKGLLVVFLALAGCKMEGRENVLELENEEKERVCQMRVILFIPLFILQSLQ